MRLHRDSAASEIYCVGGGLEISQNHRGFTRKATQQVQRMEGAYIVYMLAVTTTEGRRTKPSQFDICL